MKSYMAAGMLAVRGSIYKILLLILAMAALQSGLFWTTMQRAEAEFAEQQAAQSQEAASAEEGLIESAGDWRARWSNEGYPRIEDIVERSHIEWIWMAALLGLTVILALNGCQLRGSRFEYTMQRLPMRREGAVLCFALWNTLAALIFWGLSAAALWVLCQMYLDATDPQYIGPQTAFLAFYRNPLLHSLLPLSDTVCYLRNLILFAGLGITTAAFSFWQRQGRRSPAVFFMGIVLSGFPASTGETQRAWIQICGVLSIAGASLYNTLTSCRDEAAADDGCD